MRDAGDLVKAIQQISLGATDANNPVGIFFGEVKSIAPLQINVEQKLTLGEKQLILGSLVSDLTVDAVISTATQNDTHTHSITGDCAISPSTHNHNISTTTPIKLKLGLKVGDNVIMLRVQGGQRYIVIDRLR